MNLDLFNHLDRAPDPAKALDMFPQLSAFYYSLGKTTLLPVPGPQGGARILAKLEFENPFGSVKDRTAFGMFCEAINGHDFNLRPLKLLDASGGNMGRALAMLGNMCDIPVHLVIPDSSPEALVRTLREANGELTLVDCRHFLLGLIARAQEIALADPGWTLLAQHLNLVNVAVHQYGTGQEIRHQLRGGKAGGWVSAVGTGGTLSGVYAALAQDNPALKVLGVTPKELPYGTMAPPNGLDKFAGAGGMGFGFRQPFISRMRVDRLPFYQLDWQGSLAAMYEFYHLTGIRIGASSAANWKGACHLAQTLGSDEQVVTLFADAGSDGDREKGEVFFHQRRPLALRG
ncbi:pyridoxal-phosphate dependent enzyme [Acerihabitans arboris]|uniref:cysteine synthase n=1 Tax=Acerihabitans arboris TaxID=2691583 RepID=A0A845SIE2_9GAMM|nr:pyridoxal-phosphate dependent enzyme [Acerihabitans arboris]NDL63699.1 pyridoxal-phosphate dependent enzyme [Acerihabitans arboris]